MPDKRDVNQLLKEWGELLNEATDRWWKVALEDGNMANDLKKMLKGIRTQVSDNPKTRKSGVLAIDATRIKLPALAKLVAKLYRETGFTFSHDDLRDQNQNPNGQPQTIAQLFGLSEKEIGKRLTEELKKELADGLGFSLSRIKVVATEFYDINAVITFRVPGGWEFTANSIFYSNEGKVLQSKWEIS